MKRPWSRTVRRMGNCAPLSLEWLEARDVPATFEVINTLSSGAGSLRQAILSANSNAGPDTITFNVDGGGARSIQPTTELPSITGPVLIDGWSQPGWAGAPLIELSGASLAGSNGLTIFGADTTIRGLVINRFANGVRVSGTGATGNKVQGNYIGTDAGGNATLATGGAAILLQAGASNNQIGGTGANERNVISGYAKGVEISGIDGSATVTRGNRILGNYIGTNAAGTAVLAGSLMLHAVNQGVGRVEDTLIGGTVPAARNVIGGTQREALLLFTPGLKNVTIQGNYIGTNATGTAAIPNAVGIHIGIGSSGNLIGGDVPGAGNLISGNTRQGVLISNAFGVNSFGNRVQGNVIGLNAAGTARLPNQTGVQVDNANDNLIGGAALAAGNVVSGNSFAGVYVSGTTSGNAIRGNRVGTTPDGASGLSNGYGVLLQSSGVAVGGAGVGDGNLIAFNGVGVGVFAPATSNPIRGNFIRQNSQLGIELFAGGFGVTPNDPLDADAGPNGLQNFPVVTGVTGPTTRVFGSLHSKPNATYTLDFYASAAAAPSRHGEGERYLGTFAVATDAAGNATFDQALAAATAAGEVVTATATDPLGSTSEFSRVNRMPLANPLALIAIDGVPLPITLAGTDADGDPLTFEIVTGPAVGNLTGTGASRFYTAPLNYSGPVAFTYRAFDGTAFGDPVTVSIDVKLSTKLQQVVVDTGNAQRSMVRSLRLTFNRPVSFLPDAIEVRKDGGGSFFFTPAGPASDTFTISFTGLAGTIGRSLADGRYTLIVHQAKLVVPSGTVGLLDDATSAFHRLFGDLDGDGDTDDSDAQVMNAIPNSTRRGFSPLYSEYLDFSGNGIIATDDRDQFNRRLGTRI